MSLVFSQCSVSVDQDVVNLHRAELIQKVLQSVVDVLLEDAGDVG